MNELVLFSQCYMEVTTLISILWVRKRRSREVKYLVQSSPVRKCPRSGSLEIDAEVETCMEGLPGSVLGNNTGREGSGIELKEEVTHTDAALTSACPLGSSGLGGTHQVHLEPRLRAPLRKGQKLW